MAFINGVILLVHDYDTAIDWYSRVLAYEVDTDVPMGEGHRFVRMCSAQGRRVALILHKAQSPAQRALVGKQCEHGVLLFLQCDDFEQRYAQMQSHGVTFCEAPRDESYAKVVVFEDILGNRWDLIQPK